MQEEKNFNNQGRHLRILIAPLDWGLGHATRCIPIVKELQVQGCEVLLAANDIILPLLKKEFPELKILPLFGYNIRYGKNGNSLFLNLLLQLPKLIATIIKEKMWLRKAVRNHRLHAIISDNRPGMSHPKISSVYITHQLAIKTGSIFTDKIANLIHTWFVRKYDECWVPDFEMDGLGGELSHPDTLQSNVVYIGPLSRFSKFNSASKSFELLISISGPEPQRTLFENVVLAQLESFKGKALLVRGLPNEDEIISLQNPYVTIVNHLTASELNAAFEEAEMIVCRSGYTSVMDLVKIGKRAILVPTPGQFEQEYLARYLSDSNIFYSTKQEGFNLCEALSEASGFPPPTPRGKMNLYKNVIADFIDRLQKQEHDRKREEDL